MNKNNIESRRNFLNKMLMVGASGVALFSSAAYARGGNTGRGRNTTTETDDSTTSVTDDSTTTVMT